LVYIICTTSYVKLRLKLKIRVSSEKKQSNGDIRCGGSDLPGRHTRGCNVKTSDGGLSRHLIICHSCADQFLHFEDDIICVLLVAAISTFLVTDVPLMENGRLSTLAHLLGTHYLTI